MRSDVSVSRVLVSDTTLKIVANANSFSAYLLSQGYSTLARPTRGTHVLECDMVRHFSTSWRQDLRGFLGDDFPIYLLPTQPSCLSFAASYFSLLPVFSFLLLITALFPPLSPKSASGHGRDVSSSGRMWDGADAEIGFCLSIGLCIC